FYLVRPREALPTIECRDERGGRDRANSGHRAQSLDDGILRCNDSDSRIGGLELGTHRTNHGEQGVDLLALLGWHLLALCTGCEPVDIATWQMDSVPAKQGSNQRHTLNSRAHQRVSYGQLGSHVPLPIASPVSWPIRL